MLCSVELKYKSHFLIWKGGPGVLPRKILKSKKAGEAISGHFVRTILPSVNEQFQRILLQFIVCSFLNKKFRQKITLPHSFFIAALSVSSEKMTIRVTLVQEVGIDVMV